MRNERGFTLVEVMVVMVVLSIGIVGFLQSTLLAMRLESRSRALTAAVFLAQERIERIGAMGWELATAGLERAAVPELLIGGGEVPREAVDRNGVRFLLLYERAVPATGAPRCTVHCCWAEPGRAFDPRNAVRFAVLKR